MTVVVSFLSASRAGGGSNGISAVRAQERLAVGGTTTNVANFGETVVIGNGETTMIAVAFGTAPDAATLVDNSPVSTAGFPVGAGQIGIPIVPYAPGMKINVKSVP